MKYKLVVSDVDGTLLDANGQISPQTRKMVAEYQQQGGIFTLATGRMAQSIEPFLQELDIQGPVIGYNGSQIINRADGAVLYEATLALDIAQKALAFLATTPYDVIAYRSTESFANTITPRLQIHITKERISCKEVEDMSRYFQQDITKILIIGDGTHFPELTQQLQAICGPHINIVQTEAEYLEIIPEGASKGDALRRLAKLCGLSLQSVASVGDQMNDLSMIEAAGLGVAMANAHPEVLKIANMVTLSNKQDGVADLLRRIMYEEQFAAQPFK